METRADVRTGRPGARAPDLGSGPEASAVSVPGQDDGSGVVGKIMVWFAIGLTALTVFTAPSS